VLVALGRQAEAIPVLRRARDLFDSGPGAGPLNGGYARIEIAEALSPLGRHVEALAELAPVERLPPDQYATLAAAELTARGTALLGLGKRSAAAQAFERAAALPDRERMTPQVRQRIADGLAQARRGGGPAAARATND
jgi:tetratricopeptide (TPR) repeat protein